MIAGLQGTHAGADFDHHAGALMAENGWKQPFRIIARQGEFVGMADAGRLDFDQDLPRLRAIQLHLFDDQRLAGLVGDRGANIHGPLSPR